MFFLCLPLHLASVLSVQILDSGSHLHLTSELMVEIVELDWNISFESKKLEEVTRTDVLGPVFKVLSCAGNAQDQVSRQVAVLYLHDLHVFPVQHGLMSRYEICYCHTKEDVLFRP